MWSDEDDGVVVVVILFIMGGDWKLRAIAMIFSIRYTQRKIERWRVSFQSVLKWEFLSQWLSRLSLCHTTLSIKVTSPRVTILDRDRILLFGSLSNSIPFPSRVAVEVSSQCGVGFGWVDLYV